MFQYISCFLIIAVLIFLNMNYVGHKTFVPVMGTGFTIDTPIRIAKYGISSVISLVDDTLIEEMRKHYCEKFGESYQAINKNDEDSRARRITAYLNLIDKIVKQQFQEIRQSAFETGSEITKYFELLPESSPLKKKYRAMLDTTDTALKKDLQEQLRDSMEIGRIDVNIMTKLDRSNYDPKTQELLPQEYSDALAALRGFAKSTLHAAIVFSAGFNRRLYNYISEFKDFYADKTGYIKKRIILKVSDYRSSLIQGKFLAKKGLWVSEYRFESGLNCGGHAFVGSGQMLGPILEEFKNRKQELINNLHKICSEALKIKNYVTFSNPLPVHITAQGGIGTHAEDQFIKDYYDLDATGWGTPFLLCPEVTEVDEETLGLLKNAGNKELDLSDVSPLGVPFNNLFTSPSERRKNQRIADNRPGSPCPRGHLANNTEFTDKPICTASRTYQKLKIDQLKTLGLTPDEYQRQYDALVDKSCLCHDLGAGALKKYGISSSSELNPAICPGPTLKYYSKILTLREMLDRIYGRQSFETTVTRPHMFVQESEIYVKYFIKTVQKSLLFHISADELNLEDIKANLCEGIEYYLNLVKTDRFRGWWSQAAAIEKELHTQKEKLCRFLETCPESFVVPAPS